MSSLQINCAHCYTNNRLPQERLVDNPRCGRCKQALFSGKSLELNEVNLQPTLTGNQIPVLVDCWAPWCGPCQSFAPIFEAAASRLEPLLRFAKLNTEAEQKIAQQWAIRSIPTLILFREGQELDRKSGALPLPQLMQWLHQHLS
jgi:thioredoxin 2